MALAVQALDADLAFPNRAPQFATDVDPKWAISFYHGCGAGPYALAPYLIRGSVPPLVFVGSSKIAPQQDGWAVAASAAGASDAYGVVSASTTWAPSQTRGTVVITFRSLVSSSADALVRFFIVSGDNSAATGFFGAQVFSDGNAYCGWFNAGTDGRVIVSRTGRWPAGLVVMAVTYDSSGPTQTLYINGASVGTGTGSPTNSVGISTNETSIAGLATSADGCEWPVLSVAFADRIFSPAELAWIADNPLNWAFLPGPINTAIVQPPGAVTYTPGAGSILLTGLTPAATGAGAPLPGAGSLAIGGKTPAATGAGTVTPGAGAITISGLLPAMSPAAILRPGAGALTITGLTPAATAAGALAPGAGGVTITSLTPAMTAAASFVLPAGSVSITGRTPAATAVGGLTLPAGPALLINKLTPTLGLVPLWNPVAANPDSWTQVPPNPDPWTPVSVNPEGWE